MRDRTQQSRRGFTLVELLLVIGIIAVLLGLLIPTVARVRKAAYSAAARQNIATLVTAIEQYQLDFRSAPGLFANATIGLAASDVIGIGPNPLTQTENMVVSLTGGLDAASPPNFVASTLGQGQINPASPTKRARAYIDAGPERLGQIAEAAFTDSLVPEFLDGHAQPLPILYLRANRGAAGVVTNAPGSTAAQYNVIDLEPYQFTIDTINPPNDMVGFQIDPLNDAGHPGSFAYFANPNVPNTARQKDGYILIAAGPDRFYGTKDDITSFGSF